MILFWLISCTDPICSSPTRYEEQGIALMRTYCTSCHSVHLPASKRYGAPLGVDLNTLANIQQWTEESARRILETKDMPPGGGMTDDERTTLASWLLCGAPGEEITEVEIAEDTYDFDSHNILVTVETDPEFENTLLLRRSVDYGGANLERIGPWTEELYQIEGEFAWMVAYSQYEDAHNRGRSVFFDPPLPIYTPENSWSSTVEMSIEENGEWILETVHWEGVQQYAEPIDGQQRETEPFQSILTSEYGEEWGWQFSEYAAISAQWVQFPNNTSWKTLQYAGDIIPGFAHDFPLKEGNMWLEHLVEE